MLKWWSEANLIRVFKSSDIEDSRKPDWNDWLGVVPSNVSSDESTEGTGSIVLREARAIVANLRSHRVGWMIIGPASALTLSRTLSTLSTHALPIATTVFASMPASSPLQQVAQLGSSILLMMSIKGLGSHATSKKGNYLGMAGVSAAVLTVVVSNWTSAAGVSSQLYWFLPVAALGQYIGISVAKSVQMENLPELVAGFHSLTGLAAVLVGISSQLGGHGSSSVAQMIETFLGVSVGAATFSGSIAAAAKLHGMIPGGPIGLDSRFAVNGLALLKLGLCFAGFVATTSPGWRMAALCGNTVASLVLGTMLVLPVGGSDIPIVISFLNAMSGLATSATGFSLDNSLLVMTGALVASSGTILSEIMCKGINRSLVSVLMGGFGVDSGTSVAVAGGASSSSSSPPAEITTVSVQQLLAKLQQSKRVLVVPGYGMAVARCQSGVCAIFTELAKRGVSVTFGIHPVAGRLPGHMNVILSEADIPYDVVRELEEVNREMDDFDVVIVLGANDIVNPATATDPSSPIYGMPAIECWRAAHVVVMKRGMSTGYSGVDNPLFYLDKTSMLFGDAKSTVDQIHVAILDSNDAEWPLADAAASASGDRSTGVAKKETPIDFSQFKVLKTVGALRSTDVALERRIPISPKVCCKLRKLGFAVVVPKNFGEDCGWTDALFEKNGATVLETDAAVLQHSDVVLKVTPLTDEQTAATARAPEEVGRKQIIITSFPLADTDSLVAKFHDTTTTLFNLNSVPRISRAQSMDILSSMANIAGYKATVNAFYRIGKLSRSSVTAGGTIPAAKVFVIGCGVAGLSAIATAHAMGATVFATDVRPATKEQVESIGARFVMVDETEAIVEKGGYAGEVSASFAEKQKALYRDIAASADVVITTAMVPGRKAPVLLSAEMVRLMKPGAIVVDMAAASGGNCELSVADQVVVDEESKVIIDGTTSYASELAELASELFSQNCLAFIENLLASKDSAATLSVNTEDVIVRQSLVLQDGILMFPPPPLPAAPAASVVPKLSAPIVQPPASLPFKHQEEILLIAGAVTLGALGLSADHRTVRLVGDFVLSCIIGHFTVSSVTPALHTPLISVTNAVSGIIVVGGMLEMDPSGLSPKNICALTAVLASLVNVSGGFAVTDRMLSMFKPR